MDELKIIGYIHTDFPEKFGIPRQSGIVKDLIGIIEFTKEYKNRDAIIGLEDFNYLWLLWKFEDVERDSNSLKVRPPRLGGNKSLGVFATRSPFRPNPIGLSSVKIEKIDYETPGGPYIYVSGVDLRDNTPIYDIKPYLKYADSHPDAVNGFAGQVLDDNLQVVFPENLLALLPENKRSAAIGILKEDPRPHYQNDPTRIYGVSFAGFNIKFFVDEDILTVTDVIKL